MTMLPTLFTYYFVLHIVYLSNALLMTLRLNQIIYLRHPHYAKLTYLLYRYHTHNKDIYASIVSFERDKLILNIYVFYFHRGD